MDFFIFGVLFYLGGKMVAPVSSNIPDYNLASNNIIQKEYQSNTTTVCEQSVSITETISSDVPACYDKNILHPDRREELLSKMISSMDKLERIGKIEEYNPEIGREIYSFYIEDGKVNFSGNKGFEEKARAYEKLINASLNKSWFQLFKSNVVGENELHNKIDEIFKFYSNINNEIVKKDKKDSIENHLDEAFQRWCDEHKEERFHLDLGA